MKHRYRIPALLLALLLVCLPLTACSGGASDEFLSEITLGLWDRIILDEELHNVVSYVDAETVTYQGNTYYAAPMIFIQDNDTTVQEKRGYEYIGWSGPRFFYIDVFYGDSKDAPVILYETTQRCTYLREDYDYTADEFKIKGTEDVIRFGEALTETSDGPDDYLSGKRSMVLISSTHESLDIELDIHFYDGRWFASSSDFVYFEMSESLVEILVKNQMIESDES